MKERPIIFTAPEVRAILAGRKTMARRVVKLPEIISEPGDADATSVGWLDHHESGPGWHGWMTEYPEEGSVPLRCPYGQPGERLWVREKWGYFDPDGGSTDVEDRGPPAPFCDEMMQEGHPLRDYWRRRIAYAATWQMPRYGCGPDAPARWRSPIHMPRWASRITLEIESVRVERLQDISETDALAEGCPCYVCGAPLDGNSEANCHCFHRTATASDYRDLWEHINGAGSWEKNPFVWVILFRRVG